MANRHLILLMAALVTVIPLNRAQNSTERRCHWASGKPADGYFPCVETQEESHCCAASGGCLSNNYCWAVGSGVMYRGGCTDRSWSSTSCPQECKASNSDTSLPIIKASTGWWDSKFCCGSWNGTACQYEPYETFELKNAYWINGRATGSSDANSTTSTTSTVTVTTEASKRSNNDLSIGLGVGISLGLLLLCTAAYAWRWRRKLKSLQRNANIGRVQDFPSDQLKTTQMTDQSKTFLQRGQTSDETSGHQMTDQSDTFLRRGQAPHEIYGRPVGELEGRDLSR